MSTPELDADELADRVTLRAFVEACLVLEERVGSLREIDLGMLAGAGLDPPPFARADEAGLDVMLTSLERAQAQWGEAFAPPTVLRRLVNQGRLGRRSGQGFYSYPQPDPEFAEALAKLETRGEIAIVWLDRPPANSISPEMVSALQAAWDRIVAGGRVRVTIIASASRQLFCAGADIKAFGKMDAEGGRVLLDRMHGLLREFETSNIVTIAAVNGLAYGGGCELAMGCDLRIAAQSASFGQPEINLGLIPGFGGTQRLPRLVGTSKALEMNLTGDPVGGDEAYEIGLVNRLVADHELFDTALAWARKLSGQAPLALGEIKRASGNGDLDAGIAAEKAGFVKVFASEDGREGVSAFVQKRPAKFTGR